MLIYFIHTIYIDSLCNIYTHKHIPILFNSTLCIEIYGNLLLQHIMSVAIWNSIHQ